MPVMKFHVQFLLGSVLVAWLLNAGSAAGQCPLRVPGTSTLYLAGLPDGAWAMSGGFEGPDVAPVQSPVLAELVTVVAGQPLTITATGLVSHCPVGSSCFALHGPDGDAASVYPHQGGAENGISDIVAPFDALVGVFLGEGRPDATEAPVPLDFSTPESRDYLQLAPGLKQAFFIGDGRTSMGVMQQVIVPPQATRLYLGTVDLFGWANNYGSFTVAITPSADRPPSAIRASEIEFCWPSSADAVYTVQVRSSLTMPWTALQTNLVGTGQTMCIFDKIPRGGQMRFYRAVTE